MLEVLKFIWKKNEGLSRIKYLFIGSAFQVFKRLTGSIISKKILMEKIFFYIQIVMYPACMLIHTFQTNKR